MAIALHDRSRIGVGQLARALGETRWSMARWLAAEGVEVRQPAGFRGWMHVLRDDLRFEAPRIWQALVDADEMTHRVRCGGPT